MLGAHLDSWHGGHRRHRQRRRRRRWSMEAMRILKALGVKPRRTIRIALWSGEEQGLWARAPTSRSTSPRGPSPTEPEEQDMPSFLRKPTRAR